MTLLRAMDLSKSFELRRVLDGVSVELAPGELVALLGPSGSGKTTILRCLARLTEPDNGRILVDGQDLVGLKGRSLACARSKIGVVFQQFNLIRRLTALENVLAGRLAQTALWRVMLRRFAPVDMRRAAEALESVGLADHMHQRADTLSGGQQQRVAIARALAQESRILLADEPVASLDPETAVAIMELLRGLAKSNGLGVLCTLHQPKLAEQFADRLLFMEGGRLRAVGEPVRAGTSAA